ncbi:MAG: hypothetical protein MI810_23050 [Flavobacteriales bacterium]|jgi:hypothetical protein|nr:hypothetical protein [Flavobacteriales bacterium]
MKRTFTLLAFTFMFSAVYSQASGCLDEWRTAFEKRGAYSVADDMHRKVYISFVEEGESFCVAGKARVENGRIVSIFLQYEDGTYELMDMEFHNKDGRPPSITNGISEEIINEKKEHFYIIFVEKLKPKKKEYKTVGGPGDI